MQKFNILYIDDSPDSGLARYLDKEYNNPEYDTEYSGIIFNPDDGYESLIRNPKVKLANIIFIDSTLFVNRKVTSGKFSGEEFKIILKKYYPFIEVIVISQNGDDPKVNIISKRDPSCEMTDSEYYTQLLPAYIERAIGNIIVYRRLAEKLEDNSNWEATLKEKIINSLNGVGIYDEITKADIDNLISTFKDIQEKIDG